MKHYFTSAKKLLPLFAAAIVYGCASTPNTLYNAAPDVDFSRYTTFGFLDNLTTDEQNYESLESSYLKVAMSQELSRHGMTYSSSPDLLVNFYIHTKEKVRSRSVPTMDAYYGYRDPYYGMWGGYDTFVRYETRIDQYTEGTLNIDIIDAATNKLVWEGAISGRVTDKLIRELEQTIDDAVKDIMVNFPQAPSGG
jgi:hypothetical protein